MNSLLNKADIILPTISIMMGHLWLVMSLGDHIIWVIYNGLFYGDFGDLDIDKNHPK